MDIMGVPGLIALVVLVVAGMVLPKAVAAHKRRKAEMAAKQAANRPAAGGSDGDAGDHEAK